MRHVAQEPRLLLLELVQPRAQPFEALPDVAQVLRPVHLDRVREVGGAHPADRLVELTDRPRDQHGEQDRERDGDRHGRERQPQPLLAPLRRGLLQPLDGALRELRRRVQHALRVLDQHRVAVGEVRHLLRRPLRRVERRVQLRFPRAQALEHGHLRTLEGQQRERPGRLQEVLAHAPVVLEQRRVLEDDLLAREPLERGRLLEQQPARAPGLRRLQHLLAALRGEPVQRQDELAQRVEQRQAHEQEAQQDELEERARVIHAKGPPL